MRLYHLAASLLVGWYLIAPPIKGGSVELSAPLAKWNIEGRYHSAGECRDAKKAEAEEIVSTQTGWSVAASNVEKHAVIKAVEAEKCVPSNDPGLQKK
jgi:hypothetical protein